jgi:Ca-activated chloride channel homolog
MTMEQKLHELLCAYALGEADAAQKIEVERALASSPELRAELEKIEDTIGLVRATLGESEQMSPEAEKALMHAVNPEPTRRSWYSSGWMRMAASFLVIGGGAAWMHMLYERNTENMSADKVAVLRESEARKSEARMQSLGYVDDDKNLVAKLETEKSNRAELDSPAKLPFELNESTKTDGDKAYYTWRDTAALEKAQGGAAGAKFTGVDQYGVETLNVLGPGDPFGAPQNYPNNPDVRLQGAGLRPPIAPGTATVNGGGGTATALDLAAAAAPATPPAEKSAGRRVGKGDTKGAGDTATQSTPERDYVIGEVQPGGGGQTSGEFNTLSQAKRADAGGGKLGKDQLQQPGSTGSLPTVSGPSTGGPAGKSEDLALHYSRKLDAGDAKSQVENKAKAEGLAKKAGESAVDLNGFGQSPGNPPLQEPAQTPANEAQLRLRQLLDRSDSAAVERLARLKGVQLQEARKLASLGYASGDDRDDETRLRDFYYKLTPEQRAQILDQECRRVFDGCRRRPNEVPRDMYFRYWGDNPFEITALDPLSTFSADVDTASYTLARRYLVEGKLPEKAQIRTEEFVNYFKADVAAPTHGTFAIHTDLAPSRFAQPANSTWTLRVVVRGKELAKEERKPLNLTCVIDCSGSMREQNRMETVKDTLRLLLTQLNGADRVGIVAFSAEARQILPLTSVANRGLIEVAIQQLAPDGWTNSEAGLKLGYETALAGLDAQATNRVVFLSDGVANQGETDPVKLSDSLKPIRERGVYLNTIGVGMNNHNDTLLEQLADKGDGMCSYVDDMREAKRVMMDNFMGSVETIARDVKIQVDFDPAQVTRYRLLGYENRAIADADFRNDKVDAGEVGAGHQVTALYEIERNLAVTGEKPLATVRLRYKAPRIVNGPANEEANEIAQEVRGSQQTSFEGADAGYRRAVIVGQFAEFLRRSVNARGRSLDELLAEAHKLEAQTPQDTEFHEFVALAERSKELVLANLPNCDELCQAIDAYRTWQFQCAQAERLSHERQQQIVDDLARRNREMEEQIRELLRRRLEGTPR